MDHKAGSAARRLAETTLEELAEIVRIDPPDHKEGWHTVSELAEYEGINRGTMADRLENAYRLGLVEKIFYKRIRYFRRVTETETTETSKHTAGAGQTPQGDKAAEEGAAEG